MTRNHDFSPRDLEQLEAVGIALDEAERQLDQLRNPPSATHVQRACTPGDGIVQIRESDHDELLRHWQKLVGSSRVIKFVPASGAASRMFKELRAYLSDPMDGEGAVEGRGTAERFRANLERFAFYEEIKRYLDSKETADGNGIDSKSLEQIVQTVLSSDGLGFEALPKGLIPFHRYDQEARSAALEHLIEGIAYVSDTNGPARFHFTVSDDTLDAFRAEFDSSVPSIEKAFGRSIEIELSTQSPSTDTLAIDEYGEPFRLSDGRLLLRPSGHGALLENLDHLAADVVFIKNIDNIAPQRFHETTVLWKRLLAGYFAHLRQQTNGLAEELETHPVSPATVDRTLLFLQTQFAVQPSTQVASGDIERRSSFARNRINRPIRVAGIVANPKEPGGGPFWVKNQEGVTSPQIVEGSQVDLGQQDQKNVWTAATHLNPVDLVCGLTDRHGRRHPLTDFVDFEMAFVSRKSHAGRPLMALERPGLWNGSMAGWNTVFVEVPNSTFTPVKTVFDLLRPEHQP